MDKTRMKNFRRAVRAVLDSQPRRPSAIKRFVTAVFLSIFAAANCAHADAGRIVTGTEGTSHVKAFTPRTRTNVVSFFPYSPSFAGGVRVATGDVNGDGAPDIITATGPGAAHVKVFSGRDQGELHTFFPYGAGFSGGVFVAAGDINGDGVDDIVTGADSGAGPHVKVFDGTSGEELRTFFAYAAGFTGGVRVAAGDVTGDGRADIITGSGAGGGGHVKVFDGVSLEERRSFFAYGPSFTGGVFVSAGDINNDGFADIVTGAGAGGGPHVKVFSGSTGAEVRSFFAYDANFTGGVRVAAGDLQGDGRAEILTAPGEGAPSQVRVLDAVELEEIASFLAYPATYTNGVYLAAASVKRPRMRVRFDRAREGIEFQWPAGCECEVEVTADVAAPRSWSVLEVRPVESGNRLGMLLPAVQKVQYLRLKCDDEAVR